MTVQRMDVEGTLPLRQNVLAEEWQRAFARLDDLDANIGYLEARLVDLLREDPGSRIVPSTERVSAASPFTQRLGTLNDRIEEMVLRVESIQKRLDL